MAARLDLKKIPIIHNDYIKFFAINQVSDRLQNGDVEFFFPETTTYTAAHGLLTSPRSLSELRCPHRMTLTQSGRLCYAYAMDLPLDIRIYENEHSATTLVSAHIIKSNMVKSE